MDPDEGPPAFNSGYGQKPLRQRRIRFMLGIVIIVIILILVAYILIYPWFIVLEDCVHPVQLYGGMLIGHGNAWIVVRPE
jgi:hypothetical protein